MLCRSFSFPAWLWLLARSLLKKLLLLLKPLTQWLLPLKATQWLRLLTPLLRPLTRWHLLPTLLLLRLLTRWHLLPKAK